MLNRQPEQRIKLIVLLGGCQSVFVCKSVKYLRKMSKTWKIKKKKIPWGFQKAFDACVMENYSLRVTAIVMRVSKATQVSLLSHWASLIYVHFSTYLAKHDKLDSWIDDCGGWKRACTAGFWLYPYQYVFVSVWLKKKDKKNRFPYKVEIDFVCNFPV